MTLDYISVLAGGSCAADCSYCVGRNVRKTEKPHFASLDRCRDFINTYGRLTDTLSVSGSTSDPMLCDEATVDAIYLMARKVGLRTTLHTHVRNIDMERMDQVRLFDNLVLSVSSIDDAAMVRRVRAAYGGVRISVVAHSGNLDMIEDHEFYRAMDCRVFTVRRNVFEPELGVQIPLPLLNAHFVHNQPLYGINKWGVVLWDFPDANKYISARYLWPDGRVERQCYWHELYDDNMND